MASGAITTAKKAPAAANGTPPSGAERRASVRYPCHLDILYWKSTGAAEACRSARILDVSASGIGLLMNRPFEAGTVLTLQLENANQKSARTLLVHVVHARQQSPNEWVVGCAFDSKVSDEEARALADWPMTIAARTASGEQAKRPAVEPRPTLSSKQERAIQALLTLPTLAAAAAAVNVREKTLRTWLTLPLFQTAYRTARRHAVQTATGRLQQLAGKAVDVLERHLSCGEAASEIQAALSILAHALQPMQLSRQPRSAADKEQLQNTGNGHLEAFACRLSNSTAPS